MAKTIKLITGTIDKSSSVEEYMNNRGFNALKQAVTMKPDEIIDQIIEAKLLGRGGAGFPTGLKWKNMYAIEDDTKYLVCNADEGEAGTFKDKLFIEKDPYIVFEGMLIAAYVFGAKEGFFYMRGEYRSFTGRLNKATEDLKEAGFMGKNILGVEGFDFDLHIISGAGAYVCGENSSLLESIEGHAGRPRAIPPHLPQGGLYGKTTITNNVETFAAIPIILDRGPAYFRSVGTEEDGGTIMVCLSGHAKNKGVYEIPMGTSIRDVLYDEELGGGTVSGKEIQFFHLGGQAGAIVFPEQFDTPFDAPHLREEGLSKGTGAFVVADESVDLIKYLIKVNEFFIHESCGKCTPCREGNRQMILLLKKFDEGTATEKDFETIGILSKTMSFASFCGLGQSATTAMASVLRQRPTIFTDRIQYTEEELKGVFA